MCIFRMMPQPSLLALRAIITSWNLFFSVSHRFGTTLPLLAMDQKIGSHRIALVRQAVGTTRRGAGPQFELAPAKRAHPYSAIQCWREPGPHASSLLILRMGIGDAASFDPRRPERFGPDCAQGLYRKFLTVLYEAGTDRRIRRSRAGRS